MGLCSVPVSPLGWLVGKPHAKFGHSRSNNVGLRLYRCQICAPLGLLLWARAFKNPYSFSVTFLLCSDALRLVLLQNITLWTSLSFIAFWTLWSDQNISHQHCREPECGVHKLLGPNSLNIPDLVLRMVSRNVTKLHIRLWSMESLIFTVFAIKWKFWKFVRSGGGKSGCSA